MVPKSKGFCVRLENKADGGCRSTWIVAVLPPHKRRMTLRATCRRKGCFLPCVESVHVRTLRSQYSSECSSKGFVQAGGVSLLLVVLWFLLLQARTSLTIEHKTNHRGRCCCCLYSTRQLMPRNILPEPTNAGFSRTTTFLLFTSAGDRKRTPTVILQPAKNNERPKLAWAVQPACTRMMCRERPPPSLGVLQPVLIAYLWSYLASTSTTTQTTEC